jgi:hypothetical protein
VTKDVPVEACERRAPLVPGLGGTIAEPEALRRDSVRKTRWFPGEVVTFLPAILPFYASVGAPGAAEHLMLIEEDEAKRTALARLIQLYRNERVMESIPIEL